MSKHIDITEHLIEEAILANSNYATLLQIRDSLNEILKTDDRVTVSLFQKKLNEALSLGMISSKVDTVNGLKRKYYFITGDGRLI